MSNIPKKCLECDEYQFSMLTTGIFYCDCHECKFYEREETE